jgi:hypothetical protein
MSTVHDAVVGRQRHSQIAELYDHFVLGHPMTESGSQFLLHAAENTAGWAAMGIAYEFFRTMFGVGGQRSTAEGVLLPLAGALPGEAATTLRYGIQAVGQAYQVQAGTRPAERQSALMAFQRNIIRHIPLVGPGWAGQEGTGFFGTVPSPFGIRRTPHEHYLYVRQQAMAAFDSGDIGAFADLEGQLDDMGAPITAGELDAHIQNQMRQESGEPPRALPGEAEYVPAGR